MSIFKKITWPVAVDKLGTLHYLRGCLRQYPSPGVASGGVLVSVVGLIAQATPATPAITASLATSVIIGLAGLRHVYNKVDFSLYKSHQELFSSSRQAWELLIRADALMLEVAGHEGWEALDKGLHQLRYHLNRNRVTTPAATPAGTLLESCEKLSEHDEEAYAAVIREALYAIVDKYRNNAKAALKMKARVKVLPKTVQQTVLNLTPEFILVSPEVFDTNVIESQRPGLTTLVESLRNLDYDKESMSEAIREWSVTSKIDRVSQIPSDIVF